MPKIFGKELFKDGGKKEIKFYKCQWCTYEFRHYVGTRMGVSTQVRCPRCKNYLKTW